MRCYILCISPHPHISHLLSAPACSEECESTPSCTCFVIRPSTGCTPYKRCSEETRVVAAAYTGCALVMIMARHSATPCFLQTWFGGCRANNLRGQDVPTPWNTRSIVFLNFVHMPYGANTVVAQQVVVMCCVEISSYYTKYNAIKPSLPHVKIARASLPKTKHILHASQYVCRVRAHHPGHCHCKQSPTGF